jgi:hypothetical protein
MSSTSQALKRLGVGSVAVATVLATPYVGVGSAFAAGPGVEPTPGDVSITSQVTGNASPRNDGTDTTVKVTANVAYAPAVSPASNANAPGAVRFTYRPAGGTTDVLIGDDSTAPYSIQWTPPAGGGTGYTLYAEALNQAGNSYPAPAKSTAKTTSVQDAPSVHIVSPVEGGTLGYFNDGTNRTVVVSGTRSADLPAIDLYTQIRDNTTGEVTPLPSVADDKGTADVAAGTGTQAWSTTVTVAAPAVANSDILVTAVARGATAVSSADDSDELTQATLVAQTLTKLVVTPAAASFGTRTDPFTPGGARQRYTAAATDQNGAPIAGLRVNVNSSDSGFCTTTAETRANGVQCIGSTAIPGNGNYDVTDVRGQALFDIASSVPQTQTLTFQSDLDADGAYEPGTGDLAQTATATTYAAGAAAATLTATPSKALYADTTGHNAEYTTATPVVTLCTTDQNGNPYSNNNSSNLVVTYTRVFTTGGTTTTGTATPAGFTANPDKGNCFDVSHLAAEGEYGSDTFNAYYNNNGQAGYQAGSSDVAAAPLTLKWATLSITALDTQSQKGNATTVSFKVLGADGSPFAGRKITLTNTRTATSGFTATQPAGSTAPTYVGNAGTVIATTDANGVVSATVNNTDAGAVTVVATDNVPNGTGTGQAADQVPTGKSASSVVDFRNKSVALTQFIDESTDVLQPAANTDGSARPGDVVEYWHQLQDANDLPLRNVSTTLTTSKGFFTPLCTNDDYEQCTFDPAPADGAVTGKLKSLGKTITVPSDEDGYVNFALAIGRDSQFDVNGVVPVVVSASATGGNAADSVVSFTTDGVDLANGGDVSLEPATSRDKLSGDVQDNGSNLIPGQSGFTSNTGTQFVVHVTDQFGNLVRTDNCDVDVSVTAGNGYLRNNNNNRFTSTNACGSFTGNPGAESFTLDSDSVSTTGESSTVTATWNAPVTVFKAITPTPPNPPLFTTAAGTPPTVTKTDSFTVNLYAVDQKALHYAFASTPSRTVPVNTAVTTSVTVTDQKNNPVQGLCVRFLRSGPGSQSGEGGAADPFFGGCTLTTNSAGKAGYSYSSTSPGTATVTVIVSDASGNELGRGVEKVTFTSGTTTTGKPTFTLASRVITAGQTDRMVVRGTPGQAIEVLAYSLPNTTYRVVRTGTLNSAGNAVFLVAPGTHSRIYVRSAAGQAASQAITVRAALTLTAKASGRTGTFTGKVYPGVVGRTVTIYYVKGGKSYKAGSAKVAKGGSYTYSRVFAAPGQKVTFFAQTTKDSLNEVGRSLTRSITFGR